MRTKKLKWGNPLFVAFLAVAGIFGVSSALINKQNSDSSLFERVEAGVSGTIYLENYYTYGNPHVYATGGSYAADVAMTDTTYKMTWDNQQRSIYKADVPSGTTHVKFYGSGAGDYDKDTQDGLNMLIQRSHIWVWWDGVSDCWTGAMKTVYFYRTAWGGWGTNYVYGYNGDQGASAWDNSPALSPVKEIVVSGVTHYLSSVSLPAYVTNYKFKNAKGDTPNQVYTTSGIAMERNVFDGDTYEWKSYITFNSNGGTGADKYAVIGENESLISYETHGFVAPTGKRFKEWNTSSDGKGTSYGDTAAYTGGTGTLYAIWENDTFSITLDNISATSAGTTTIYEKYSEGYFLDSSCTQQMTASDYGITLPTKTGYEFRGYYTGKLGTGNRVIDSAGNLDSGASLTQFSSAGTLYAKWIRTIYYLCGYNYSTTDRIYAWQDGESAKEFGEWGSHWAVTTVASDETGVVHFNGTDHKFYRIEIASPKFLLTTQSNVNDKTGDLTVNDGYAYTWGGIADSGSADVGAALRFILSVESARNSVTAHGTIKNYSICGIASSLAGSLCGSYDSLSSTAKTYVNNSSTKTYVGDGSDDETWIDFPSIIYQLSKIASNGSKSAIANFSPFNLFNDENGLSTIIIIIASSVALLSVTALSILVIKKRKTKED